MRVVTPDDGLAVGYQVTRGLTRIAELTPKCAHTLA